MAKYLMSEKTAAFVRGLMDRQSPDSARGHTRYSRPASAVEDSFAHPFEVRFAASLGDGEGSGSWIIWLPRGEEMLTVEGEPIDLTAGLEAAGDPYPAGWFVLDDVLDASDGGDLYIQISRADAYQEHSGEFEAEFVSGDDLDDDDDSVLMAVIVASCEVASSGGGRSVRQFLTSDLVIGGLPAEIAGDDEGSEWLKLSGRRIVIQAYPGSGEGADEADNCGLTFTTVSEREGEEGETIPAKIIVGVKDKSDQESWAAKSMLVPLAGGGTKLVHFLGCDDVDLTNIGGGGGGGGGSEGCACEGSDYIDISSHTETDENDNETTHKVVAAKINTVPESGAAVPHALLTNDTEQTVSAKKTFVSGQKSIELDASTIPQECSGAIAVHELKYKDKNGNVHTYHGLLCGDVDLSDIAGKTIKSVSVTPSSSEQVLTFTYTDNSTTTIHIPHGLPGSPGSPGQDGDTPEITADKNGGITHIYADGDLIASIMDGSTPTITASKSDGVTTIYADGVAIAQINDGTGSGGELPDKNVVDDVSFAISGGKLVATLSKSNLKTGATSTVNKEICDVGELDVVVSEAYSTSSHQFTNTRKRVKVIGTPSNAQGQTPFTATPLSGE